MILLQKKLYFLILILLSIANAIYSADSEVVKYASLRKIDGDNLVRIDSFEIQINNRKGEAIAGNIRINYTKKEKINLGDVWLQDMKGNIIRKLGKSEIKDHHAISNYSLYEDDFVKEMEIRHNAYPYKICYSYKIVASDFLYVANWIPYLKSDLPVKSASLTVEIPVDYLVKKKEENITAPEIQSTDKTITYTWNTSYDAKKRETNAPLSELNIPHVIVEPLHFKYGIKGSWESWQSFGEWVSGLNEKGKTLPLAEQEKVKELVKNIADPKEKVNILYRYLQQNTRYINVKIDVGGFKSYPAEYVATNKYGDCKALSNYMLTLLDCAGIKSYYTLIKSGDEIEEIDKNFPSQAFNHVIVTVPLAKDTIFLECTSKNFPCGYLGTFTQGRDAFIVDGENSRFVKTPELKTSDVISSTTITIPFLLSYVDVNAKIKQRGEQYELFTYLSTELNKERTERYIHKNIYAGSFDLQDFSFKNENLGQPEITLFLQMKMMNNCKVYGNNYVLSTFSQNLPEIESPENRTQAIQFDYPIVYQDTITYKFSSDMLWKKVPENVYIKSDFGEYAVSYNYSNTKFSIIKNIVIFRGRYEAGRQYNDFYKYLSAVKSNEQKNIYLEVQ